jgi:hypothetical protein
MAFSTTCSQPFADADIAATLYSFYNAQSYFGQSLEECNRFADLYYNTCDNDVQTSELPPNVASIVGKQVSCVNTGKCVNSGQYDEASNTCTWTHKLCAYCTKNPNDEIKITIMSNGLP